MTLFISSYIVVMSPQVHPLFKIPRISHKRHLGIIEIYQKIKKRYAISSSSKAKYRQWLMISKAPLGTSGLRVCFYMCQLTINLRLALPDARISGGSARTTRYQGCRVKSHIIWGKGENALPLLLEALPIFLCSISTCRSYLILVHLIPPSEKKYNMHKSPDISPKNTIAELKISQAQSLLSYTPPPGYSGLFT